MTTPKFCRIAIVVDDMPSFTAQVGDLLGIPFVRPLLDEQFPDFTVMFGEHGLEPIAVHNDNVGFAKDGSLIEVAIDVASAGETKAKLADGGFQPIVENFLPTPAAYEYLFGRDFHGLPLMICTAGDNETEMRVQGSFLALDEAPAPKIGCITLGVQNLDSVAADLTRFVGMAFVETDAGGFGGRALTGSHRIKLVDVSSSLLAGMEMPLASIDFMTDDVEGTRARFEQAGYAVKHSRTLASGNKAYYFGVTVQNMPVSIYHITDDAEILGQQI